MTKAANQAPMLGDDVLVIVLAGGAGERLAPLTRDRAKPAVYFGGPYRIIDFVLSNCINSGLRHIFIATQYKSLSLNRHIRQGWTVVSEELGEFVEILPPQKRVGEHWYQGTADAVYQNLYSIIRETPKYVVVLAGDHVYKMDYQKMLRFHQDMAAEVTLAAIEVPIEDGKRFGIVAVDETEHVTGFLEKPADPPAMPGQPDLTLASMGIYVFDSAVLIKALEEDAAKPHSHHDFGKDIIPALIGHGRTYAYPFYDENKKAAKYWRDIGTIDAYYEAQMDLCQVNPEFNMYDPGVAAAHLHAAGAAGEVRLRRRLAARRSAGLADLAGLHRLGQPDSRQHPVPERARAQLLHDRGFDPDARRARRTPRADPQGDHRPRRRHPARRLDRFQSRRRSAAPHRVRRRRRGGRAGR